MKLTRRDAVAALAAAGVAVAGGTVLLDRDEPDRPLDDRTRETLVAAARVLYPTAVDGVDAFVERYADGRAADPDHAAAVADAAAYLDEYARAWYGDPFVALSLQERDEALGRMRLDAIDADPDGGDVARVRYYVVDELLFALYASPTGGELLGIENPPGHPGGLASYQRGPGRE